MAGAIGNMSRHRMGAMGVTSFESGTGLNVGVGTHMFALISNLNLDTIVNTTLALCKTTPSSKSAPQCPRFQNN